MTVNRGFSRKQNVFITELVSGASVEKSARVAGVSITTGWRWHGSETVQSEIKKRQREVMNGVITKLKSSVTSAIEILCSIMKDVEAPTSARVSAARVIVEIGFKAIETEDILGRIEILEQQVKNGGK